MRGWTKYRTEGNKTPSINFMASRIHPERERPVAARRAARTAVREKPGMERMAEREGVKENPVRRRRRERGEGLT